jgi:hypothetical protein
MTTPEYEQREIARKKAELLASGKLSGTLLFDRETLPPPHVGQDPEYVLKTPLRDRVFSPTVLQLGNMIFMAACLAFMIKIARLRGEVW